MDKPTVDVCTPELRAAVDLPSRHDQPHGLNFFKRDCNGYYDEKTGESDGWDRCEGRFIQRALARTKSSNSQSMTRARYAHQRLLALNKPIFRYLT